ncbi:MAG: PVC-type heme-binding CxxCH protein [Pirellulales bacterium]
MARTCRRFIREPSWLVLLLAAAGAPSARAQGLTAEEATRRMQVPAGFAVEVVAAEPLVRQPVAIEWDDRGRLWVIQYLQYPNPAGLQRVQVDRYSRTRYDRVPEPPPHGPRGADRITILEDSDGDGRCDRGRDFVAGLNLATGLACGHGGVFVLNVPYLLFYPDRNRDDVPDGDPEVLLSGFGMEDAHSVANSLTWGPDGWLYGCQGSTVTAQVRDVEFQQGVWRYHPVTREFELFCEGGGNTWGLDFDSTGRLFYSTNFGGYTLVHGVQGAYYVKSFGKHGALHNPHAYGYFEHAPHQGFRGGHVTVGGLVYQGGLFPESFRGRYIGGDLLGHAVYWHDILPWGSTVRTAHGGELLEARDPWFAPSDLTVGPDGALYVADWHDARTAHPDPDATWDRSNGRIFRLAPVGSPRPVPRDLSRCSADELRDLHSQRNQWWVRRSRQELARRQGLVRQGDGTQRAELDRLRAGFRTVAASATEETAALEALWSVHALEGFDESLAIRLLASPHPAVRAWTVRLLGDTRRVSDELAHRLDAFAEQEPVVAVRQQLACTAARLPAAQALPIINAHINRDLDRDDPFLPLLWWWAVEKHSVTGRGEVLRRFVRPTLWKSQLGREVLLTRLVRRYAAERSPAGLDALVQLIDAAPDAISRSRLWAPILQGWQEQFADQHEEAWRTTVQQHALAVRWRTAREAAPADLVLLHLGVLWRDESALAAAERGALDPALEIPQRVARLSMLAEVGAPRITREVLELVVAEGPENLRVAALQLLAGVADPQVAERLVALHRTTPDGSFPSRLRDVILSRAITARVWLTAVDRGEIPPSATPLEQIRRVALLNHPELDALVAKHWGRVQGATREEKLAEVRRLNNDLRAAGGQPAAGRELFRKHCATCHQLFGEGARIGPDLTSANRQDRDFLLVSLVDPSSVIRKEYVSVIVETKGGRVLTGLPVERSDTQLTLADTKGERQTLPRGDIAELHESPVSLMPDDLYRQFTPQQLRDLFAYLQSPR